jgi:hypothetical protein
MKTQINHPFFSVTPFFTAYIYRDKNTVFRIYVEGEKMKVKFKHNIGSISGKLDDEVYYYNRNLKETIMRRHTVPERNPILLQDISRISGII